MNAPKLTDEQKKVLYEKATEAPFTSDLLNEKRSGVYVAADTGEALFRSEDKFDSGSGWPSFTKPISSEALEEHTDGSLGMIRTEVTTPTGSHLGHVFTDGPKEAGGLRYCINGAALKFISDEEKI
jgi:methionine-R-sulfoxide reductase